MERHLRIAIACYPTLGGSGVVATELGIALAEKGHDIHFLAYAEPLRISRTSRVQVHLVEVSAYPLFKYPPYDLALASKMRELLVHEEIDILHVHYAIPHAICAYLARQMAPESKARIVTTLHGTDITVVGSDAAYLDVTRFGIENSDRVLAVSAYLAAETCRLFRTHKEILIAPNFVDTARFLPGPKAAPGETLKVVHVSNFRPVKRPLDVVQAFALACKDLDATLTLVGDGPQLESCMEFARKLGVTDRVHALGTVQDVETVLATADLLLQPSGTESFGLAALEAISCGTPVIGYQIGGLPEVIVEGKTGFLVAFRDVKALAARAREVLTSPQLRASLAQEGRRDAVERFNVHRSVERHEAIYFEVLAH